MCARRAARTAESRDSLGAKYADARDKAGGSLGYWLMFMAVCAIIGAIAAGIGGAVVGILGAALATVLSARSALRRVDKRHQPRLRALEADIAEAQRQLRAATARMDGLVGGI